MTSKSGTQPQDHKLKAAPPVFTEVDVEVGEGQNKRTIPALRGTIRDVELVIEKRRLDDYRTVQMMARAHTGDLASSVGMLERLAGEEQQEAIIDACADEDGFAASESVFGFMAEIFNSVAPNG